LHTSKPSGWRSRICKSLSRYLSLEGYRLDHGKDWFTNIFREKARGHAKGESTTGGRGRWRARKQPRGFDTNHWGVNPLKTFRQGDFAARAFIPEKERGVDGLPIIQQDEGGASRMGSYVRSTRTSARGQKSGLGLLQAWKKYDGQCGRGIVKCYRGGVEERNYTLSTTHSNAETIVGDFITGHEARNRKGSGIATRGGEREFYSIGGPLRLGRQNATEGSRRNDVLGKTDKQSQKAGEGVPQRTKGGFATTHQREFLAKAGGIDDPLCGEAPVPALALGAACTSSKFFHDAI